MPPCLHNLTHLLQRWWAHPLRRFPSSEAYHRRRSLNTCATTRDSPPQHATNGIHCVHGQRVLRFGPLAAPKCDRSQCLKLMLWTSSVLTSTYQWLAEGNCTVVIYTYVIICVRVRMHHLANILEIYSVCIASLHRIASHLHYMIWHHMTRHDTTWHDIAEDNIRWLRHTHARVYANVRVCVHVCVCESMCMCTYVCVCVCMCMYELCTRLYLFVQLYIYIYIHTYTYTSQDSSSHTVSAYIYIYIIMYIYIYIYTIIHTYPDIISIGVSLIPTSFQPCHEIWTTNTTVTWRNLQNSQGNISACLKPWKHVD